jgi:hypothetical protein
LVAEWPTTASGPDYAERYREIVRTGAAEFVGKSVRLFFPNAHDENGFRWELWCGAEGRTGAEAIDTQYISVNIDPSERYVQAVPGSDRLHRIRGFYMP